MLNDAGPTRGWVGLTAIALCALLGGCAAPRLPWAAPAPVIRMGDVVRAPGWEVTVRSIERLRGGLRRPGASEPEEPAGRFALVVVDLTNRTDAARRPDATDFELTADDGARFANRGLSPAARAYAERHDLAGFGDPIAPGATTTTLLVFDIDPAARGLTLHFRPAADQPIVLDECHCSLPMPSGDA